MSVLARDSILKCIETGDIVITPYDEAAVGCASVDLTLSNEFRYRKESLFSILKYAYRFYKPGLSVVPVVEDTDYKELTEKVILAEGEKYLLLPGCACLGITQEKIKLAPSLCGLLEGRSRFARLGLFVHITAGFMNPGIENRQVLEIYNASNHPLALVPGQRVCQFIFMRMEGSASYAGKFSTNEL